MEREFDKHQVLNILKNIFELEMSGVVRYTHYSLMIFGSNPVPLVDFFRSQAKESLSHADLVGDRDGGQYGIHWRGSHSEWRSRWGADQRRAAWPAHQRISPFVQERIAVVDRLTRLF